MSSYAGQKYRMGLPPHDVPPPPGGRSLDGRPVHQLAVMDARFDADKVPPLSGRLGPRAPASTFDAGVFAVVRMEGQHGASDTGPAGYQFLVFHRISRDEALRAAWAFYGSSPVTLWYLDARGDVLATEQRNS